MQGNDKERVGFSSPEEAREPEPRVVIRTRGLSKAFGENLAVRDLDLEIREGEFFGFLGPNGSGKSTTIKMLTTLLLPTGGTMEVAGMDVLEDPLGVKRVIGTLPEEIQTYERLTVGELVLFAGRIRGLPRGEATRRSRELLDLFELAESERSKLLVDCSLGMKKKALLTCALIHAPRVLFLDEPFNGIDPRTSLTLRRILTRLTRTGTTIFFSSHILEIVAKLCTRIAILDKGRILAVGDMEQLAGKAGLPPGSELDQIFLELVGGHEAGAPDLSWLS